MPIFNTTSFSAAQLEQLWIQNGGNPAAAKTAAAVALAESRGIPTATNTNSNGSIDRGLWQINSVHGAQSTTDVIANVKAAIAISNNGANWSPWTTFKTGAYKTFLGQVPTLNTLGGTDPTGAALGSAFAGVPGLGAVGAIGQGAGALGVNLPNPLSSLDLFASVLAWLTTPANWLRILEFVAGAVAVFYALMQLSGADRKVTQVVAATAGKVR